MGRKKENMIYSMFSYNEETKRSKCLMEGCNKYVTGHHGGNLIRHFYSQHRKKHDEILKLNEQSKKQLPEHPSHNFMAVMEHCTRLVAVHGRPFSIVEDEAFTQLLRLIPGITQRHVQELNVENLKENIRKRADQVRLQISKELKNKLIALKVDVASVKLRRFLGLNMQYISDGKTILQNLSVIELHDRNTAAYLKEIIALSLSRYDIELNQILSITTDNGANMLCMANEVDHDHSVEITANENESINESIVETTTNDEIDDLELDIEDNNVVKRKVTGIRCAAHCLQLAVKGACEEIEGFLEQCRQVITSLRTPDMSLRLRYENLPQAALDTATRWETTADMLLNLQKLKTFCMINSDAPADIWHLLDIYVEVLQPCKNLSKQLQTEQLTCGDFFIAWMRCRHQLALINDPFSRKLEGCMITQQDMLFENEYFVAAIYLDPRVNSVLTAEQASRSRLILSDVYTRLVQLNWQNTPDSSESEPEPGTSTREHRSNFDEYLRMAITHNNNRKRKRVANDILENEIKCKLVTFLQEPLLPSDANILYYWEVKKSIHPHLYNLAKVVLATPATSVSVARLFSSLKFVLNNLTMSLDDSIIEDIMIVRNNHLYAN